MINKIILVIIIGFIVTIGCTDSSMNPVQPYDTSKGIVPLAVGNTWVRFGTSYNKSFTDSSTSYDTMRITRDTLINGVKWYFLSSSSEQIISNQLDGLYFYFADLGPSIWLKYPANQNYIVMVQGNTSLKVANSDTIITVPAGTFHCYRYDYDIKPSSEGQDGAKLVYYVSPNNGFIKYETYFIPKNTTTLIYESKIEVIKIVLK